MITPAEPSEIDLTCLAGINPTSVFSNFLEANTSYRTVEPISFTGWSTLLLAEHSSTGVRRVAKALFGYNSVLKTAPEELVGHLYGYYWYRQLPDSAHAYMAAQFEQEIEVLESLGGTGIAPELHESSNGTLPYYVMDHIPAGSVRNWKHTHQPGVGETATFAEQLLTALDVLHANGFIHRDLNAENVLVGPNGPLIADFGCALRIGEDEQLHPKPALLHWPPEYDQDYHRATVRSDLYCFAMIIYELLSGTLPRYGAPQLGRGRAVHPPKLADLLEQCLAWDPRDRPASARACLDMLRG